MFAKGFTAVQSFLADVTADPDHELRHTFDERLRDLARRLRSDPEQAAKIEQAKGELLDRPDIRDWLADLWLTIKKMVRRRRRRPEFRPAPFGGVADDARRGGAARRSGDRRQGGRGRAAAHRPRDQQLLATTSPASSPRRSQRWDTEETSRRLELQVGRDLQFIRINGTVVGALAGLAIYAVSQLF